MGGSGSWKNIILGLIVACVVGFVAYAAFPSFATGIMNLDITGLNNWEIAGVKILPFFLLGFIALVVYLAFKKGGKSS